MRARVVLVILSIVAAAWLGLSLRNASWASSARLEILRVSAQIPAGRDPAALRRAADRTRAALGRLHASLFLNPDRTSLLYEATGVAALGDRAGALRRLRSFTAAYPDDVLGWVILSSFQATFDPPGSERARARARALNPLEPR